MTAGSAGTPATFLRIGQIVAGRYKIVRQIARGGMSEVYEVEDNLVRERVALKILRKKTARDPEAAERFRREILLARRITHPNVCRIFEAGVHESVPFLTMELLAGENLLQLVGRVGRMKASDAEPIIVQVCDALTAAHRAGVVHRDLKSSNILLVPQAGAERGLRAVITDFGVARALEPDLESSILTGTGVLVGTPAYMAPEQVDGTAITEQTDIYALGVVMYEMLTGELPFTGANPLATAELRLKKPAPSPRTLVPDLEVRWERAILRCLMVRPEDRFQTPGEALAALKTGAVTEALQDEDATTIDEQQDDVHGGPTVPMTADQVAVLEAAIAEVQAKRTAAAKRGAIAQLPRVGSVTESLAPTVVATPPGGETTIPPNLPGPPAPSVQPPDARPPSPGPAASVRSALPTDQIPQLQALPTAEVPQQPVRFVAAAGPPARPLEETGVSVAQTRPRHVQPARSTEDMAKKRLYVLCAAIVAMMALIAWLALNPLPSSLFGPK